MKIQYHNDQIRVRLTSAEVEALATGRAVEYAVRFGEGSGAGHAFRVEQDEEMAQGVAIRLDFQESVACIRLTPERVAGLDQEHTIGQEVSQPVEGAPALRILVERDLKPRRG